MSSPRTADTGRRHRAADSKRFRFVALLLAGASPGAASEALGANERTGRAWASEPDVVAALAKARETGLADAQARVGQGAATAVDTLVRACLAADCPWPAKVTAATQLSKLAGLEAPERKSQGSDLALLGDAQLLERLVSLQERLRQLRDGQPVVQAEVVGSLPSPSAETDGSERKDEGNGQAKQEESPETPSRHP